MLSILTQQSSCARLWQSIAMFTCFFVGSRTAEPSDVARVKVQQHAGDVKRCEPGRRCMRGYDKGQIGSFCYSMLCPDSGAV